MEAQLLNWMIFIPSIAALVCLIVPSKEQAKSTALFATIVTLAINVFLTVRYYGNGFSGVAFESEALWIEGINVYYRTGVDGLSLPLVLLASALSVLIIMASWRIEKATKAYLALYLFLMTGMYGVFLALDLFLFYVFFEVSLLPMYFLIGVWGGPRKEYAAIKFFLFTLAGSICLLIVMLGLYFLTPKVPGGTGQNIWAMISSKPASEVLTLQSEPLREFFSQPQGSAASVDTGSENSLRQTAWTFAQWAFWLTFIAFAIKIPIAPLHTWLPDAHVEAPTPISMILAGVLLKMGGYALMRITYPFFPDAAVLFWIPVASIGVFSIIYGALCSLAQTDWKKLVAYSSVSHMGYVTLGIAVLTRTGFDGAYFQMIAHGITSAMMFFLVGVVYDRAHHREINRLGGLWLKWPGYGGWSLVGFFAGMGLPGLCGFIGEIMVLLGTFEAAAPGMVGASQAATVYTFGILAAFGVILTAGYILWMFQRVYMGNARPEYSDYEAVSGREYFVMGTLGLAAFVFGILPYLIFSMTMPTFDGLLNLFNTEPVAAMLGG